MFAVQYKYKTNYKTALPVKVNIYYSQRHKLQIYKVKNIFIQKNISLLRNLERLINVDSETPGISPWASSWQVSAFSLNTVPTVYKLHYFTGSYLALK